MNKLYYVFRNVFYFCIWVIACNSNLSYAETLGPKLSEHVEVSGFGRLVGGHLSLDKDDSVTYLEYEDNQFMFDSQSLFGLQLDVSLSKQFSLSSQFIAHSAESRDSGVEWLYLSYQPNDAITVKAGRLRVPFFNYSDVIDVGYAYPWITPPRQVYVDYLFSNYDGINTQYTVGLDDITVTLEGYLGKFDDDVVTAGQRSGLEVDGLRGLVLTARHSNTKYRLAYHEGKVFPQNQTISGFQNVLFDLGYNASANSLEINGDIFAVQAGISYYNFDYFFDSEFILLGSDSLAIPEARNFYVTAGLSFSDISVYSTLGRSRFSSPNRLNNIIVGRFPELDLLAQNYNQIFDLITENHDEVDTISIGGRWDFKVNQALKIEVTRILGNDGKRAFFSSPPQNFAGSNDAVLTQVAFEWVF